MSVLASIATAPVAYKPEEHLDALESEAIFILREVAGECERPVLLCSGTGEDHGSSASDRRLDVRRDTGGRPDRRE
jgi:hypothetical protein